MTSEVAVRCQRLLQHLPNLGHEGQGRHPLSALTGGSLTADDHSILMSDRIGSAGETLLSSTSSLPVFES
jgi:hypothetical protein